MVITTRRPRDERGFTLIEFMIAAAITAAVLSGAMLMASQLQQVFSTQLDDTTVEEEVRFALDWIGQALRNGGSNPYSLSSLASSCPAAGTFQAIELDPDGDGEDDDIRIHADVNPPNGLLGGASAACDESNEDLTIAHDPEAQVITRLDNSTDAAAVVMTEPIITGLLFTYLDSDRNVTANVNQIAYVRVRITGESKAHNVNLAGGTTSTLESEVHIRTR